jgi:hypothetical protein
MKSYESQARDFYRSLPPPGNQIAEWCFGEIDRLRAAIVRADLQIGDGHIEQARRTLHGAMDKDA